MVNLVNLLAEESANNGGSSVVTWIILAIAVIAFIVMTVMNNKNRKKQAEEEQKKRDSLCARTKVITIGGIVGEVVSVDEAEFVLNTEGVNIRFDKRAIYQMTLPDDVKARLEEERKAELAAKEEEKKNKKIKTETAANADDATEEVKDAE